MSERLFPVSGRTQRERAETRARVGACTPTLFDLDPADDLDACAVCASLDHDDRECRHGTAPRLEL